MFENIKEGIKDFFSSRLTVAAGVMVVLFGLLLYRMFYLQIVSGQSYQDDYALSIVKERTLGSTRGNIYDRNGNLLAYNELAYSVTIEDNGTYPSAGERNEGLNAEIAKIISALEKNGDSIINDFRIDLGEGGGYEFNVSGTAHKRFLADVYGEASYDMLGYSERLGYDTAKATADQVMDYLMGERCYDISQSYGQEMAYEICVVRFAMAQNAYQKYIVTTIATNVSEETVAYVSEHAGELQGVDVVADTVRRYNDSVYFTSILGYTGKISSEEYEKLSAENDSYTLNDVVGKGGIEQYMDAELKGTKGYEKIYVDHMGKVLDVIEREEPVPGKNVYLSLDRDLQIAVYRLLEQEIAGIVYSNIDNESSDIPIPIEDVYFALINNNVIDIGAFSGEGASETERAVHSAFLAREDAVRGELSGQLEAEGGTPLGKMDEEFQDYYTYFINKLKQDGVLLEDSIDKSDDVYKEWQQGNASPGDYLRHAISESWVDITKFSLEEKYSDSAEIYDALCDYLLVDALSEKNFSKIIYEYLIRQGKVTGTQLCLILFDQGVLPQDRASAEGLAGGSIGAAAFLKEKIRSLQITPAQLALDPCSGSCVVTDTRTGEVLAMVSYPGYDGNRLANSVDAEYFESLQNDHSLPQYNYATQQGTAPGSTFKMVSATAGLAEGAITVSDRIQDLGVYENVSNEPKCWIYPSAHGNINVSEALRDSCNYFFYEVGYRLSTGNYTTGYDDALGISKLQKYASMYGLDEPTGIEIEESSPKIADSFPVMAAIGQSDNQYTTVQLSRYVTAVADGGTVYRYTLLSRLEDSSGEVIERYAPEVRNEVDVLGSAEWDAIHQGMRMVVENLGEFSGFPIEVAGKTGTAQENLKRPNHALFVGYAPYANPEISVAARIAYGYTSHNAAELARNVFAYYFGTEDEESILSGVAEDVDAATGGIDD